MPFWNRNHLSNAVMLAKICGRQFCPKRQHFNIILRVSLSTSSLFSQRCQPKNWTSSFSWNFSSLKSFFPNWRIIYNRNTYPFEKWRSSEPRSWCISSFGFGFWGSSWTQSSWTFIIKWAGSQLMDVCMDGWQILDGWMSWHII